MIKNLQIYCDGSRDEFGKLGIGLVYVSEGKIIEQFSYGLPITGESYIAEYIAVICALSTLDTYVENLTICTDQINILHQIMGQNKPSDKQCIELYNILENCLSNTNCRRVRFKYIKSHSNNNFHNLADKLADLGRKTV